MSSDTAPDDLIDQLLFEFIDRQQAGESPSISEYCSRHPDQADEIRDVLSTLSLLDNAVSGGQIETGTLPEKIGDYQILGEIGRGGMGVVYDAQHHALGRRVALKVLPGRLSKDKKALARFHREARAVAKLHHTNIVPMFEIGTDDGRSFIAMQLITGQSLDRVLADLKKQAPSVVEKGSGTDCAKHPKGRSGNRYLTPFLHQRFHWIARIGQQTAEALAYAHSRGIVHRDVKPSNMILDDSGVTWLTDFGLAKTDDEELTQAGDFVGTLRYMAPERFRDECDVRADIYSLGLTLYELLTLKVAFKASDRLELIWQIDNVQPIAPSRFNSNIPRDLETIVLKAIHKDPAGRYQTAGEFAEDLQRFLEDRPVKARRQSALERLYRWSRRNKRLAAALSAVAALLVLIAVGTTLMSIRSDRLQRIAEDRGEQLQTNLYFAEMNIAGQASNDGFGVPTIRALLQRWEPARVEKEMRGWEWYYLYSLTHRERFETPVLSGWTWSVDYNPAGTEYVNCINGWGIQVRSAETGEVVREKFLGSARYVDWSPDGKQIAVAGFRANVNICDAQTLEVDNEIDSGPPREVYCVKWHPDGDRLATCRQTVDDEKHVVRIWNSATGELLQTLKGHAGRVDEMSWSPDGTQMATAGDDNTRIWDCETGKKLQQFPEPASSVSWCPDGNAIALGNVVTAMIKDTITGKTIASLKTDSPLDIRRVRWRPGQRQLACGHGDSTVTLWDIDSGNKIRTLYGHSHAVRDLAWNPQGTQLVSSGMDNTVRLWEIETSDQTQVFTVDGNVIQWSRDGSWLSVAGVWTDIVSACHPDTGKIQTVDDNARQVDSASISPDGQKIAYCGRDFLKIWDKQKNQTKTLDQSEWVRSVSWNHDGSRLVACTLRPELVFWNADTGDKTKLAAEEQPNQIDWSPDGTRLATGATNGMVTVRDADGNMIWQKQRGADITHVRWSFDGSQLASTENGAIVLWDAASGEEIITLNSIKENFNCVDWSPDASRLVSSSLSSVAIWDLASGHVATKLPPGGAQYVRWSPDGNRIAAARSDAGVYIWDATPGYERSAEP